MRHLPALFAVAVAAALTVPVPARGAGTDAALPPSPALPPSLGLPEALALFRTHGLDLLLAEANIDAARHEVALAAAIPNPSVGLLGAASFGCPTCVQAGVTVLASDSGALMDTLSGRRPLRRAAARAALDAARHDRADAERQLAAAVAQRYVEAALAESLVSFGIEVLKAARTTAELTRLRYKAGAVAEADEAKADTALLEAEQRIDEARQRERAAKVQLAFLIGVRGPVPEFAVDREPEVAAPALLDRGRLALIKEALTRRPDLASAEAGRVGAAAALKLAQRQLVPDLSLQAGYQGQGGTGADAIQPPTFLFGVTLTLPLLYQAQGELARARALGRQRDLARARLEAQVVAEVESSWAAFEGSHRRLSRYEGQLLQRAARARELVLLQYQKGAASLLELLDAQRGYIANFVAYLDQKATYLNAVFDLEKAVGMTP